MTKTKGRWLAGTFVLDGSVVGTVQEGGNDRWFAYGCLEDWEDVNLSSFQSEDEAKQAVEHWVDEHEG